MATPTAPEKLDGGAMTVSWSGAWRRDPDDGVGSFLLHDPVGGGCAGLRGLRHLQLAGLLGGDHRGDLAFDRGEQRLLLRELRGDRLFRRRALGDDALLAGPGVVSAARLRWTAFRKVCTWPSDVRVESS